MYLDCANLSIGRKFKVIDPNLPNVLYLLPATDSLPSSKYLSQARRIGAVPSP